MRVRVRTLPMILLTVVGLLFVLALVDEGNPGNPSAGERTATTPTSAEGAGGDSSAISRRMSVDATVTPTAEAAARTLATPLSAPAGDASSYDPSPTPERAPYRGMWLTPGVIDSLPMAGAAWQQLKSVADQPPGKPRLHDKDADGDVRILARALVYARTGEEGYRAAVMESIEAVMDEQLQPESVSVLAVARNLPGYIIAADLINLPQDAVVDKRFRSWLQHLQATVFSGDGGSHSIASCHERRPNNFGTHCGAARVAIALYLGDGVEVDRVATVFHGWLGNREAYIGFEFGRLSWQSDPDAPVGINPPGATIDGISVDGALPEEMRRAGEFRWPPRKTGYAWEALQGAVVQAELLAQAGYPAWQWEEQALLRVVTFLYDLGWEAKGDDGWQPWLINDAYGTDFPAEAPAETGKNMGWTDWTHGPGRDAAAFPTIAPEVQTP